MDVAAFKAQLEASRAFEAEAGGATFSLRLPTEHAWRLALEANRDAHGRLLEARAMRAVLDAAIVGWRGVTGATLMVGGPAEPLAYTPEARALLLEHRQDIADQLTVALGVRIHERREALEVAAKN